MASFKFVSNLEVALTSKVIKVFYNCIEHWKANKIITEKSSGCKRVMPSMEGGKKVTWQCGEDNALDLWHASWRWGMELGCECMIEHQFMVHTLEFATCILACVDEVWLTCAWQKTTHGTHVGICYMHFGMCGWGLVDMWMTEKQFMVHTLEVATCILTCMRCIKCVVRLNGMNTEDPVKPLVHQNQNKHGEQWNDMNKTKQTCNDIINVWSTNKENIYTIFTRLVFTNLVANVGPTFLPAHLWNERFEPNCHYDTSPCANYHYVTKSYRNMWQSMRMLTFHPMWFFCWDVQNQSWNMGQKHNNCTCQIGSIPLWECYYMICKNNKNQFQQNVFHCFELCPGGP